jgi:hypothetical protein
MLALLAKKFLHPKSRIVSGFFAGRLGATVARDAASLTTSTRSTE